MLNYAWNFILTTMQFFYFMHKIMSKGVHIYCYQLTNIVLQTLTLYMRKLHSIRLNFFIICIITLLIK